MTKFRFLRVLTFGLMATACSVGMPKPCDFGSKPGNIVQTITINGSTVLGDVKQFRGQLTMLNEAVAQYRSDYYDVKMTGICQGPFGPYRCTYIQEVDVSDVYGRAYSNDLEEAKRQALENCRNLVERTVRSEFAGSISVSATCRIVRTTTCPV